MAKKFKNKYQIQSMIQFLKLKQNYNYVNNYKNKYRINNLLIHHLWFKI